MSLKKGLVALLILSFIVVTNEAIAEDVEESAKKIIPSAMTVEVVKEGVQEDVEKATEKVNEAAKEVVKDKEDKCACGSEADAIIEKAYDAVEEDEWSEAIGVCNETISKLASMKKDCECFDVSPYEDVAKAFLNYAKGGQQLDEADEIDCKLANSVYKDAIALITAAAPKIKNESIKEYATDVSEYCEEEIDFVKDECE